MMKMVKIQLLSKASQWREIIDQAMQSRPKQDLLRNVQFPCLPQSIVEFLAISNDPNAAPKQMAAPIEADSALTLSLLREVNSTAVGLRQTVESVARAITLLGIRRTKTLVLASALQSATANASSPLVNHTRFHAENQIRAAFARRTAQALGVDCEIAYLAGMLQDCMLPILAQAFYSDYVEALQQPRSLVEEEQDRLGWNHASIAAGLMLDWGFPDELTACVLMHHDFERVLSDASLRESSVCASIAAASLPDSLSQSPNGLENLIRLQDELHQFRFLSIAADIDEQANFRLSERLEKMVEERLTRGRHDRVHLYRQLGNYTLEKQIAQGAMGTIYLAQHCMLARPVAVKVLRSTDLSAQMHALFQREVRLTSQLTSPNTVTVFDFGVTQEGLFYYVMEYIDGHTVQEIVQRCGPLPAGRVIHFLRQVCNSLAEAHSLGLVHRDIKPDNLMVCTRGGIPDTIKVLDFGLAIDATVHSVAAGGTPLYMSPESTRLSEPIDGRSDLYSLGAVGYFMLTGKPVFPETTIQKLVRSHQRDVPRRPSEHLSVQIDKDLEDVVLQCLLKSRDHRPASAEELGKMLSRCRSAETWDPRDARTVPCKSTEATVGDTGSSDGIQDTFVTLETATPNVSSWSGLS